MKAETGSVCELKDELTLTWALFPIPRMGVLGAPTQRVTNAVFAEHDGHTLRVTLLVSPLIDLDALISVELLGRMIVDVEAISLLTLRNRMIAVIIRMNIL